MTSDTKTTVAVGAVMLTSFLAFIVIMLALAMSGCSSTALAVKTKPSGPCLTVLPTKTKFVSLHEPERVPYLEDSEARVGMRITVDAESAAAFFNYVEALERVAKRALGCRLP
jgi:hypothetical protein